jgi:hypothetical protein
LIASRTHKRNPCDFVLSLSVHFFLLFVWLSLINIDIDKHTHTCS